ncbi:MAG: hypothetical protein P8Y37_11990 [Anaerolineales bacterium]
MQVLPGRGKYQPRSICRLGEDWIFIIDTLVAGKLVQCDRSTQDQACFWIIADLLHAGQSFEVQHQSWTFIPIAHLDEEIGTTREELDTFSLLFQELKHLVRRL